MLSKLNIDTSKDFKFWRKVSIGDPDMCWIYKGASVRALQMCREGYYI